MRKKKLIHYTTRNKIFHKLHLWPYVLLQARIRNAIWPDNEKTLDWYRIASDHFHNRKPFKENIILKESTLKKINKAEDKIEKEDFELKKISAYLKRFLYNKNMLSNFISSTIGRIEIHGTSNKDIKVKYLNAAYSHFITAKIPATMLLKEIVYQHPELQNELDDWARNALDFCKFHEVTKKGFNQIDDYSFLKKTEICLIAENYKCGINSIACLPKNSKVKIYLIDEEPLHYKKIHNKILNIEAEFFHLEAEVAPTFQKVDIDSVKKSEKLAKLGFDFIQKELESLLKEDEIEALRNPSQLLIEDLIYYEVKKLRAFQEVFAGQEAIYFSFGLNDKLKNYFFSCLNLLNEKKIYITTSAYSLYSQRTIARQTIVSKTWHTKFIRPIIRKKPNKKANASVKMISAAKKDFLLLNKPIKNILPKTNHILSFVHLRDSNYNKSANHLLSKLLEKTSVAALCYLTKEKHITETISNLKATAAKQKNTFRLIPIPTTLKGLSSNKKEFTWQHYIAENFLKNNRSKNSFIFAGFDYRYAIHHGLRNFLFNYLPAKIQLRTSLLHSINNGAKTTAGLLLPGRSSVAWLCADILKEKNIKILDQQVLFQSSNPRYKASPANLVAMLNDEQIDIYKSTFGKIKSQKVIKFGSILFNLILENYQKINIEDVYKKYSLPKNKQIILIASQNSLTDEFIEITSVIAKIANYNPNIFVILRLHPKEDATCLNQYKQMIEDSGASNSFLVTTDADTYDLIKISDTIITLYSNVGMDSAMLGKDVIIANISKKTFPIDLAAQGLAHEVTSKKELESYIKKLLNNGITRAQLKQKRQEFIDKNVEFVDGKVIERISEYLLQNKE